MSFKRMSVQMLGHNSATMVALGRGRPHIVKLVDGTAGLLNSILAVHPDVTVIWRVVVPPESLPMTADMGREWGDRMARIADGLARKVSWFESPANERSDNINVVAIQRQCEFDVAFANRLRTHGLKSIVGHFATGNPDATAGHWEYYHPAIDRKSVV